MGRGDLELVRRREIARTGFDPFPLQETSTPEPFGDLMDRCADIARRANAAFKPD